jgi:hypothetical protein
MRNLSKVLALVLSLAFVLTMFAGAIDVGPKTYADQAELSAAGNEAVAVLSALGIVNGYPDEEFKPANDVTRAEFAKMLSVAVAGTDVNNFYATTALPFSDEFDAWCIPYVNFAYLNEIMVGYGDNTMRPKNNVTGFEAAKMVLVGLGYDPKVEGLEGPAWQSNTAKLANRIGLLKNLESENLYGAFDREATAILVRNAIYTETVEYVGSYANGTGETLGEKVFDLIDVRGIVVANDYGAIGLNWEDVLTGNTVYNKGAYIQYTAPAAGQTRFAYRDYTGAATEGGYYVPRVITVKIASDNADLGKAFRVLATGAKNPANTDEIRKVYGILGEIASDNSYTVATSLSTKNANGGIDGMLAAAQLITPSVTEESVQGNIFIDGKPASYKAAKALIAAQASSTYPYYYVDNDNDGTYDFVYLYTFKAAKVLSVDAENKKLTISGIGTKAFDSVEGIAAGDFIAYWADEQYTFAKKLDTYTGKVTAYTRNSGDQQLTYAGGKYTINGKDYTFGHLATTFTDDERVYFQQLLGLGTSAVQDATLKFVFDGSYIVAVFVDEKETHWDNYAIVVGVANDTYLGMGHVRLLTEDNEYKDFYVASYNGQQIYNNIASWSATYAGLVDYLVRYEEIGNNQIALYSADWVNASYAYTNDVKMVFDTTTGMWEGHEYYSAGIQNGTLYDWKNGVVFVSYGNLLDNIAYPNSIYNSTYTTWNSGSYQWRAYLYGEFMPSDADEAGPATLFYGTVKDMDDEVVYATALNGVRTLKAAAIIFDWYSNGNLYTLPGLPLRAGQAIWGTIMSTTAINTVIDPADSTSKYAYTVKILKPWSTSTQDITVYSNVRLTTFVAGDIYKLFIDKDGIARRWEKAASSATIGNLDILGTDYLELGGYVITGIVPNSDGSYYFIAKKGNAAGTFSAENVKLYVSKDADLYFVKNLFKPSIEAVDYIKNYGTLGTLSFTNHKQYIAYFDINPTTNEVLSGWIDVAGTAAYTLANVPIKVTYDTNTKKATYTLDPAYGVFFAGGATSVTVTCEPYELKAPIGDQVFVNLGITLFDNGGWYVAGADAISGYKWVKYDATNAAAVDYTPGTQLKILTPGFSMNEEPKLYNLNVTATANTADTQAFWLRVGTFNDVYPIYGADAALAAGKYFYKAGAAGQGEFAKAAIWSDACAYNPDGFKDTTAYNDAYNYEAFWVMYNNEKTVTDTSGAKEKQADANMIVYIEQNGTVTAFEGGSIAYPYIP